MTYLYGKNEDKNDDNDAAPIDYDSMAQLEEHI